MLVELSGQRWPDASGHRYTNPDSSSSLQVTPGGVLQLVSPSRGVLWVSNEGSDSTVADSSMPEVEMLEEVVEDHAPAEDVRIIGGTYAATYEGGNYVNIFIPAGTQSDPSATFSGTETEAGLPDETFIGTYNHPNLKMNFSGVDIPCIVADDAESMVCDFFTGTETLTRQ